MHRQRLVGDDPSEPVVVGAELDPICPPAAVAEVVEALPANRVTFVELSGRSHLDAAADGLADLVRDFIAASA